MTILAQSDNHSQYQTKAGRSVSAAEPCPICDRTDWCFLIGDSKVVCGRETEAPQGWEKVGDAADGRSVFAAEGSQQPKSRKAKSRGKFPELVKLPSIQACDREAKSLHYYSREDIPQWHEVEAEQVGVGDRVWLKHGGTPEGGYTFSKIRQATKATAGKPLTVELTTKLGSKAIAPITEVEAYIADDKGRELICEYFYSQTQKVTRRQWTDRRGWYKGGKTKEVRPHFHNGHSWQLGKGEIQWPLYRQDEAIEAIRQGGIVFAVAGEQAVEALRLLGLVALTCQGGESRQPSIPQQLADAFSEASEFDRKPLLVCLPDHDEAGQKASEALLKECRKCRVTAIALDPLHLCPDMPPKGDIIEFLEWARSKSMDTEAIRQHLEDCIDASIEAEWEGVKRDWQRKAWEAPVSKDGEIGYWVEDKEGNRSFKPRCDFDFEIMGEVASADGGALVMNVKRVDLPYERQVIIAATEIVTRQKFETALTTAFGTQCIVNLKDSELKALLRVRRDEYLRSRRGKVYKLIDRYGVQSDGTWVFGDEFQVLPDGKVTNKRETDWTFNPNLGKEDFIPSPQLAHQNGLAGLRSLMMASQEFFRENFPQVALAIGWTIAGLHRQAYHHIEHHFPLLNLHGEAGSGKTMAMETALSLVSTNWGEQGILSRATTSALYEHGSKTSSLPFCWDDPPRDGIKNFDELLKSWFNGKPRRVRGNEQTPRSPLALTTNHVAGSEHSAAWSRIVRLPFRKLGTNNVAYQALRTAQTTASSSFVELLKWKYDPSAVGTLERELLFHLPNAHPRIAKSLALVVVYAQQAVDACGIDLNLKDWAIANICPLENGEEDSGDSLKDFLDKVGALEAQSLVGDWNKQITSDRDGNKWVALYISDIWPVLDHQYSPSTYDKKALAPLVAAAGGKVGAVAKFNVSKDETLAYYRALLNPRTDNEGNPIDPVPPRKITKKCWFIPIALFEDPIPSRLPEFDTELPELPQVTSELPKKVTPCNSDSEGVSDTSEEPSYRVTEKIDKGSQEEEKGSTLHPVLEGANVAEETTQPNSISEGVTWVTPVTADAETLTQPEVTQVTEQVTSSVTEGNLGNLGNFNPQPIGGASEEEWRVMLRDLLQTVDADKDVSEVVSRDKELVRQTTVAAKQLMGLGIGSTEIKQMMKALYKVSDRRLMTNEQLRDFCTRLTLLAGDYPETGGTKDFQRKERAAIAVRLQQIMKKADWKQITTDYRPNRVKWVLWRQLESSDRAAILPYILGECEQLDLFGEDGR